MKINVILAGFKAHARMVFNRLKSQDNINIIGVFTGDDDNFCLLDGEPVGETARKAGITVYNDSDLTLETLQTIYRKERIDMLILVEWKKLISEPVFSFPVYGSYCIHDSLLPRYRGSSPMNWAIINGETETGATFFRIINKADSGPIFYQEKVFINSNDYALDVLLKMIKAYENAAINGVNAVINKIEPVTQDETAATYGAARLPEDGLLSFDVDVGAVYNQIRALTYPFPGTYAYYGGIKVQIIRARIVKKRYNYVGFIPGYILNTKAIWVLCRNSFLHINEIKSFKNGITFTDPQQFFTDKSLRLVSTP
tara:strand:- start:1173 stop:2108 length:936 start_codon:yes stop_codon:yes gene_type:complete